MLLLQWRMSMLWKRISKKLDVHGVESKKVALFREGLLKKRVSKSKIHFELFFLLNDIHVNRNVCVVYRISNSWGGSHSVFFMSHHIQTYTLQTQHKFSVFIFFLSLFVRLLDWIQWFKRRTMNDNELNWFRTCLNCFFYRASKEELNETIRCIFGMFGV